MMFKAARRCFLPCFLPKNRYFIIADLFAKKNRAKAKVATPPPPSKDEQDSAYDLNRQTELDMNERRREIDTSSDFVRLRQMSGELPESMGKGGVEEVLYWSQQAVTPVQVRDVVSSFNSVTEKQWELEAWRGNVGLQALKQKVLGTIYLCDSVEQLAQCALFGWRSGIEKGQFWQKIEYKVVKMTYTTPEQMNSLVDIAFLMGQTKTGEYIYNQCIKTLQGPLSIDMSIKMFVTFSLLQKGEQPWISKLLDDVNREIRTAEAGQLGALLPCLKKAKKLPEGLQQAVAQRGVQIIRQMRIWEVLELSQFLGFQHEDTQNWVKIQSRMTQVLEKTNIDSTLLQGLIHKALPSYKLSTAFIMKYVVAPAEANKEQLLSELSPGSLASFAKSLYIYEMQKQTAKMCTNIGELVISKVTADIGDITDEELVGVIKDYNITRHGSRQIFIFFEQAVKIKYIKHYHESTNRATIQMLIQIYKKSGMCSHDLFNSLQALVLDSQAMEEQM